MERKLVSVTIHTSGNWHTVVARFTNPANDDEKANLWREEFPADMVGGVEAKVTAERLARMFSRLPGLMVDGGTFSRSTAPAA